MATVVVALFALSVMAACGDSGSSSAGAGATVSIDTSSRPVSVSMVADVASSVEAPAAVVESWTRLVREADAAGAVTAVMARTLPLWLCFEDPIRVAQLKLAPGRIAQIRRHAQAKPKDLVHVREFLRPRVEEIAGLLPNAWGRAILRKPRLRQWLRRFERDVTLTSTSVTGYLLLRFLVSLRVLRPRSLRYTEEHRWLTQWHAAVVEAAGRDTALAVELAECQSLVRGYGETLERGHARLQQLLSLRSRGARYTAAHVRELRLAAEQDADGDGFERTLARVAGG